MFSIRQKISILVIIIGLLLAGGCAVNRCWYQPGKSFQQTVRDYNISTAETVKSGSTSDNTSMTIHTYPYGWGLPSGYPIDITYGAGGRDIAGVRYYIMKAKGYRLVHINQLPPGWMEYDLGQIAD